MQVFFFSKIKVQKFITKCLELCNKKNLICFLRLMVVVISLYLLQFCRVDVFVFSPAKDAFDRRSGYDVTEAGDEEDTG